MALRWNAWRLAISAYLIFHMTAVVVWVLPGCPVKERLYRTLSYYMMPLGLWQYWAMFAPDPVRDTLTLETEVIDSKGLRYHFMFPRLADYTAWQGIPRFRYSKYTANLAPNDSELLRKFAARHAVRQLGLQADTFPVDAHVFFQVRETSQPGQPLTDPMTPTKPHLLTTFHFDSIAEVRP